MSGESIADRIDELEPDISADTPTPGEGDTVKTASSTKGRGFLEVLKSKRPEKNIESYDDHDLNIFQSRTFSYFLRGTEGFLGELLDRYALLDYAKAVYRLMSGKPGKSMEQSEPGDSIEADNTAE